MHNSKKTGYLVVEIWLRLRKEDLGTPCAIFRVTLCPLKLSKVQIRRFRCRVAYPLKVQWHKNEKNLLQNFLTNECEYPFNSQLQKAMTNINTIESSQVKMRMCDVRKLVLFLFCCSSNNHECIYYDVT